ncbi:AraC family transcriptional regulator [Cohnella zeiphila]|uniref:AraC family transcriptional regulator n=1 Tax=Cohnella zeiphila TaxID=2761120 RepID=A0A7X0STL3_9BACL|nr:AraC family transcriptional regulator [Cohnella zeiphila]MBB6735904.1 AraC family transcriptional regulator [Cohnella zeiphila]
MNINHLHTIAPELVFGTEAAFRVHYWGSISDHRTHPLHKHSFFECCCVTSGEGGYIESGERYPLYQGDIILSRPDAWHQIESADGIGLAWVAFMPEDRTGGEWARNCRRLTEPDRVVVPAAAPSLTASLWQTLRTAEPDAIQNRTLLESIACSLLLSCFQTFLNDRGEQPKSAASKPRESVLLHKARLFIRDNLSLRIKLQDLAEYLHISERHLSRLFNDELGMNFSDYYRQVKIRTATALLESTTYTLEQIAANTGFYSVHHFAKSFKLATGTPPGQWRKERMAPAAR